ncbi:MAG: hypothetical protein NVSMB1_09310 [Polyangiales bacterium]
MRILRAPRYCFSAALLFAAAQCALACGGTAGENASGETAEAIGFSGYERFPSRPNIVQAVAHFRENAETARARGPMKMESFFGRKIKSLGEDNLHIELLKSDPRESDKPLAFLYAQFQLTMEGQPDNARFNDRFKDVRLLHLSDALASPAPPFPEAVQVNAPAHYDAVLVRVWADYHPLSKGAPPRDLHGDALLGEIARMGVWSYVTGNLDGPAVSLENAGFARFRDASGREFWRGVLIDGGATLSVDAPGDPMMAHYRQDLVKPWNMNILDAGGIKRRHIPNDVMNSVREIANASDSTLATWLLFDAAPHKDSLAIVRQVRKNALEVLDHYITMETP